MNKSDIKKYFKGNGTTAWIIKYGDKYVFTDTRFLVHGKKDLFTKVSTEFKCSFLEALNIEESLIPECGDNRECLSTHLSATGNKFLSWVKGSAPRWEDLIPSREAEKQRIEKATPYYRGMRDNGLAQIFLREDGKQTAFSNIMVEMLNQFFGVFGGDHEYRDGWEIDFYQDDPCSVMYGSNAPKDDTNGYLDHDLFVMLMPYKLGDDIDNIVKDEKEPGKDIDQSLKQDGKVIDLVVERLKRSADTIGQTFEECIEELRNALGENENETTN